MYSIDNDEIILKIDETSNEGTITKQMNLNLRGMIESEECCKFYNYLVSTPMKLGDEISNDLKILSETTYEINDQSRSSWVARDSTGQNIKIIDKDTGLVFLHEYHETEVLSVGDYIKITDTNFFGSKFNKET